MKVYFLFFPGTQKVSVLLHKSEPDKSWELPGLDCEGDPRGLTTMDARNVLASLELPHFNIEHSLTRGKVKQWSGSAFVEFVLDAEGVLEVVQGGRIRFLNHAREDSFQGEIEPVAEEYLRHQRGF